ncbi:MAG: glycosyltransferase family 39 protein [Candidatus Lindowbacteria bacterium]|nr:glycosyltransferase family 39 protein [Candidatus Lindowbacteria bacterium]
MLRLYMLDANQLWLDETHSIFIAGNSLHEVVAHLSKDGHPPLYFSLLLAWKTIFGESEFSVRLLSVLFGAASMVAIFFLGSILFSRHVGLVAMFTAAIAPLQVYYSQEAKMYILLAFFSATTASFLWLALTRDRKRYWWGYVLSAGCLVYTHILGWFSLSAGNLFVLLDRKRQNVFTKLLCYQAVVVLLFTPWIPILPKQINQAGQWMQSWWKATPPSLAILKTLECFGAGGNYPAYLRFFHVSPLRFVSCAVFGFFIVVALYRKWPFQFSGERMADGTAGKDSDESSRSNDEALSSKGFVLLSLFVPLAIPYALSFFRPLYLVGRNDVAAYPFYAVLVAVGITKLRRFAWAGLAAVCVLSSYSLYKYYSIPTPSFEKETVQYLSQNCQEGDIVVVMGLRLCPVEYYMRRGNVKLQVIPYPSSVREHPGWLDYRPTPAEWAQDAQKLTALALEKTRQVRLVWLLTYPMEPIDQPLFDRFDHDLRFVGMNPNLRVVCFARR